MVVEAVEYTEAMVGELWEVDSVEEVTVAVVLVAAEQVAVFNQNN